MLILKKTWFRISRLLLSDRVINAVRCTSVIIAPVVLFTSMGLNNIAINTGLGAILISLTDLPGPRSSRLRFLLLGSVTLAAIALVIALSLPVVLPGG